MGFKEGYENIADMGDRITRSYYEGQERGRQNQLRGLASLWYGGQVAPENEQKFLGDVARLDPQMAAFLKNQGKEVHDNELRKVGDIASMIVAAPDTASRARLYESHKTDLQRFSQMTGLELPPAWDDQHMGEAQFIAQRWGSGATDYKPMNVSPGGEVVDPRTGRVIHANQNFAPMKPQWDSNRGGWAMPPDQGASPPAMVGGSQSGLGVMGATAPEIGNTPAFPNLSPPQSRGGFMQVAPPRPNYEGERLRIAQEANQRAAQAATDAAEVRRRSMFGTAPAGQRFRQDGTLEDIPGYHAPASANADAVKTSAQQSALAEDAYSYAAADTGIPAETVRQMTPAQVRDLISGKPVQFGGKRIERQRRWATGPIAGRIPGMGYLANADLEAYRNASAGKQARINNPTGPVTNADFDIGARSVWGPDKPDEVNAQLVFDAISRATKSQSPPSQGATPQKAKEGDIVQNAQGVRLQLKGGQWVRIN